MPYALLRTFHSKSPVISLTKEEFDDADLARRSLLEALFIEEKMDMLLQNYSDLEQTLLGMSIESFLFQSWQWSEIIKQIHLVNRRCVNLLTTCRLHIDQVPQNINAIYGANTEVFDRFEVARKHAYSSMLGYRVCYALRNYVQHNGFPIDRLINDGMWLKGEARRCQHVIGMYVSLDTLREGKFKKGVLDELPDDDNGCVDLKPLIRQNVAAFGAIHNAVSEAMSADVTAWTARSDELIKRYQEQSDGISGLAIAVTNTAGKALRRSTISSDFANRLKLLQSKNKYIKSCDLHFASGDVRRHFRS